MAEKGSVGGGVFVGEEEAAAPRAGAPMQPTITLPPRSSFESLFRGGGGESKVSPGPLTLVPSFFVEYPTRIAAARRTVGFMGDQEKEAEKRPNGGERRVAMGWSGWGRIGPRACRLASISCSLCRPS
ncbi:putative WRKY transcription factor 3 [Canna indica]|uniref:WRKY transcription factor 3 n=1 Tax=Canna indica TaxID=4628 RepID=A0AAQ3KFT7_9LILI|nr:putative WRKY transcription factor 3 [Canna indica]